MDTYGNMGLHKEMRVQDISLKELYALKAQLTKELEMYNKFFIELENIRSEAEDVFNEYYEEKAMELGEEMQGDDRFYGDDGFDCDPIDLYEDFSHCTGDEATWYGAYGVIKEFGAQFELDPENEDIQTDVLTFLGQSF